MNHPRRLLDRPFRLLRGFRRRVLLHRRLLAALAANDALHAEGGQVFAAIGSLHMIEPERLAGAAAPSR